MNAWTFVLAGLLASPAWAWEVEQPDSPEAQAAALGAAPESRDLRADVRPLASDVRQLKGMQAGFAGEGLALSLKVESITQAIEDLGAEVREMEILIALSADVLFDFDKADIKPAAAVELGKAALIVRERRKGRVGIAGHTDAKGADAYNQKLSERRARAVKDWLAREGGVEARVMDVQGRGEREPVAPNARPDGSDDPEGRARNRRVEIRVETGSWTRTR
jgi:outer membrane protein OmpA-like peptidoglycan-associated protein